MSELAVASLCKASAACAPSTTSASTVGEGEFLALIGPNGAGKSTCFNMINGQLTPDGGDDPLRRPQTSPGCTPREICRLGVGRTFQVAATFGSMTVRRERADGADLASPAKSSGFGGRAASRHRERALELLDQVGMEEPPTGRAASSPMAT